MDAEEVPPRLEVKADEAHLWYADLESFAAEQAALSTLLSASETARAARYATETLRVRFIRRRAIQRLVLARYVEACARSLAFSEGPQGKPFLAQGPHFNLSDSGDHLVIAVATQPVGVDIEAMQQIDDADGIVASYFAPAEAAAFAALPGASRRLAFYQGWTRKEAYVKALGSGFSHPLADFVVELRPGEPARFLAIAGDDIGAWTLLDFRPAPGVISALAIRKPGLRLVTQEIRTIRGL